MHKTKYVKMNTFGEIIKKLRLDKECPLRVVAAYLDIDQAILSKIENGKRDATKKQVLKLAGYYQYDEKQLLIAWLSDKIIKEIYNEDIALQVLHAAEDKLSPLDDKPLKKDIVRVICRELKKQKAVAKAWMTEMAGNNFTKENKTLILIEADVNFTYFQLVELQQNIEKILDKKIEINFIGSFRQYDNSNLNKELVLIYNKASN